jgi:hypothetical protein
MALYKFTTNRSTNTPVSGLGAGDSINKIEICWKLSGTDADEAAAMAAGRGVTWNSPADDAKIAAFQTTTGQNVDVGSLVLGAAYTPAIRITENKSGGGTQVGAWSQGEIGIGGTPQLLLYANGSHGSTTIVDSSPNAFTVTAVGNAALSTTQKQSGTASIYLDGAGDYLSIPDASAFNFGAGNFAIRVGIRPDPWAAAGAIYGQGVGGVDQGLYWHITKISGTWRLLVSASADGVNSTLGSGWEVTAMEDYTWADIALVRVGNVWTMYVNDTSVWTTTQSLTIYNSASTPHIGHLDAGSGDHRYFKGFMDNFMISV